MSTKKQLWRLTQDNKHNAFGDLVVFADKLICCFRRASAHVSPDGVVRLLTVNQQGAILRVATICRPNIDLRDPKLSVMPDGRLMLLVYGRHFDANQKHLYSQSYVAFSHDGISFSALRPLAKRNWWLWRLRWDKQQAGGFAYNRRAEQVDFYLGNPLGTFECVAPGALSKSRHQRGYPNESDLCFDGKGNAVAIVRRDADSGRAQLGHARFPYTNWHWQDLPFYIGSPVLCADGEQFLVAGRIFRNFKPYQGIFRLDMNSGKPRDAQLLPSGGDCGYPGLVKWQGSLWLSYYSSHESAASDIYLCRLNPDSLQIIE